MQRSAEWQGVGLIIIGAFCFSSAILFVRLTDGLGALTIAFYRALFAFIFLSLLLPKYPEAAQVAKYRTAIPILAALGLIVALTVALYTYSIKHTTAANAALLVNSSPLYVAVLGPLLLKEKPAKYTAISLVLAVIGIVLLSDPQHLEVGSEAWDGIMAGALSGFTYAWAMLIGRKLRGRVTGLTQTMWSVGITMLVLTPWAFAAPGHRVVENLPYLIPLGIFSLGLSYLCYFSGLQRIPAQVVSVVALFEPVAGILIGLIAFGEVPGLLGVFGGVLILISIYLISQSD